MRSNTQRVLRHIAIFFLILALGTGSYFIYQAYFPKSADYSLDAKTDRLALEIQNGGPPFAWANLEVQAVDGAKVTCTAKLLQFGDADMRVTVTVEDQVVALTTDHHASSKSDKAPRDLRFHFERMNTKGTPIILNCSNGTQLAVVKNSDMRLHGRFGQTLNLPVYAQVQVGGVVDPQGGPMALLINGTLKASARPRGSTYVPVSNQIDLRPGDEVQIKPDSDRRESLSIGVIQFDGNDLAVVTHAKGAVAIMRRAGSGTSDEFNLKPGPLAIIQSNPMWAVTTFVCSILSGLISLVASRKGK